METKPWPSTRKSPLNQQPEISKDTGPRGQEGLTRHLILWQALVGWGTET